MSDLNEYRRYFILAHDTARKLAAAQCMIAPQGYIVEIKAATRTLEQNARMWSCLAEISAQVVWHGRKLTSEEWKIVFTAALKKQEVIPGIDGGFVAMGQSTSRMTKKEMADLMTLMDAFAIEQGVEFNHEIGYNK